MGMPRSRPLRAAPAHQPTDAEGGSSFAVVGREQSHLSSARPTNRDTGGNNVNRGRSRGLNEVTSGGARYVGQRLGLLFVFVCILSSCAGRWNWPRGWAYVVTVLLVEGSTLSLLALRAPETLNQRGIRHPGIKSFDTVFAVLWLALALGAPAVAGLDAVRFHWSSLSDSMFYVGLMILLPASALGT